MPIMRIPDDFMDEQGRQRQQKYRQKYNDCDALSVFGSLPIAAKITDQIFEILFVFFYVRFCLKKF